MSRPGQPAGKLMAVITAIVRPWRFRDDPVQPGPAPGDWARQRARDRVERKFVLVVVLGVVLLILVIVDLVH